MGRRAVQLLDVVGITLAALLTAFIVDALVDESLQPRSCFLKETHQKPDPHVTLDANQLARAFGIKPKSTVSIEPQEMPPVAHLRGTVLSNHADWSWALLDEGHGAIPRLPGDSLGDCVLESVESDRAIVRCGHTLHALELSGPLASAVLPVRADADVATVATLSRADRDRALVDPTAWLTSARMLPVLKNGKVAGLRALWVQPDGPAAKLGLQAGDVIESVDGIDVSNLDALMAHLPALLAGSRAVVALERAGSIRNVAVELRD